MERTVPSNQTAAARARRRRKVRALALAGLAVAPKRDYSGSNR
jgi:ribosomal protein L32